MPTLKIIATSTRDGRASTSIASWFAEKARAHGKFDIEVVDLAQVALPMLDEPNHPRFARYEHEHTKAWSRTIDAADAFVFVVPEYNFAMPPALLNALDYLFHEWKYKAAGFVSYGGVSGGTRSVVMAKQVVTALRMMAIPEAVNLPFFNKQRDENGKFDPGDVQDQAVVAMLDELLRWTNALESLRRPAA